MNPFSHTGLSISDSLKSVRKSVLIYETIILIMQLTKNTNSNYTVRQLKLPLEIEKIIDISDPVYTFCDVMDHIDL